MNTLLHIALATSDIAASITDYSRRLQCLPCVVVPGQYALWRTASLNLSLRYECGQTPGRLRHLGWEDPLASAFTSETDCNGLVWERFAEAHQREEILARWPDAIFK